MKTKHYILLLPLLVLMALLTVACSSDTATADEQPLPEGMGRIRITICTPEANPDMTRAVNLVPWEEPDHDWEKLHSFRILIFDKTTGKLVDIIERKDPTMNASTPDPSYQQSATVTSDAIPAGSYYIYATANCHKTDNINDAYDDGFIKGNTYTTATCDAMTFNLVNGYSEKNIPMSGKLTQTPGGSELKEIAVAEGTVTDAGTITVWRMVGKLQFEFTNEATEQIKLYGIEVEPINTNASNQGTVYLFSQDNLASTDNLAAVGGVTLPSGVTNGKARHSLTTPTDPLLTLNAYSGSGDKPTGNLFFYVNETNGTFTTTNNEISLRFIIKRGDATEDELRFGLTTRYGDGTTGQNGFNVIRRNDWIHIPIFITDWQYRVEPLAFVPIAGYPAATVSSDGLTATYSTGGMIALQPFIKKKGDASWRDFGDPEVSFVSITWKNSDTGTNSSGDGKIVKTPFTYDPVNKYIIGELNNTLGAGTYKTTITVNVDLGTSPKYHYTFSCNVVLQK